MVLDYCVLRGPGESDKALIFTKDQLISLIERSSPDTSIEDLPGLAARGLFKPVTPPEPENTRVLLVEEGGSSVSSIREALLMGPSFPEWWGIPIPLAMFFSKKLYFNPTANALFGPNLKRMATCTLPNKDEFLVELEGANFPCLLTFRRLDAHTFMLEDSTGDAALAEDIAWWASIGKAWTATLDEKRISYRRCTESEAAALQGEDDTILPCEWEGRLLGYFCVENPKTKKNKTSSSKRDPEGEKNLEEKRARRPLKVKGSASERGTGGKKSPVPEGTKNSSRGEAKTHQRNAQGETRQRRKRSAEEKEKDPLGALGPQTMALLAPESNFLSAGSPAAPEKTERLRQTKRSLKKNDG
jgi:hypothetical protein